MGSIVLPGIRIKVDSLRSEILDVCHLAERLPSFNKLPLSSWSEQTYSISHLFLDRPYQSIKSKESRCHHNYLLAPTQVMASATRYAPLFFRLTTLRVSIEPGPLTRFESASTASLYIPGRFPGPRPQHNHRHSNFRRPDHLVRRPSGYHRPPHPQQQAPRNALWPRRPLYRPRRLPHPGPLPPDSLRRPQ